MNQLSVTEDAVTVIYECAMMRDTWAPATEALRKALGGTGAWICAERSAAEGHEIVATAGTGQHLISIGEAAGQLSQALDPKEFRSDSPDRFDQIVVLRGDDATENGDFAETMVHPVDLGRGGTLTLAVIRGRGLQPFNREDHEAMKGYGRHFASAIDLCWRRHRGGGSNHHQSEALDQLSIAGLEVDRFGEATMLNHAAAELMAEGDYLKVQHGRLVANLRRCNIELQSILKKVFNHQGDDLPTYAMSLENDTGRRPLGLVIYTTKSLCPVSKRMENSALIFARDPDTAFATDPHLLQKLFSFTPAEAKLAIGLAKGLPLKEIEFSLKIRHNTARAHLRAMFLKAEVGRQAELVSLLTNSIAPLAARKCRTLPNREWNSAQRGAC